MNRITSFLRKPMTNYPGTFGFAIGFFSVYFMLSILPRILENLLVTFSLIATFLIIISAAIFPKKAPIFTITISCLVPSIFIIITIIVLEGVEIYELADTLVTRSAIVAVIATLFATSLKVTVDAWRAWAENVNKEQDLKLCREIFEYEKQERRAIDS